MNSYLILQAIDEELNRLRKARNLLAGLALGGDKSVRINERSQSKRFLSPEARQRIVDAQKRRWAAYKASA